MEEILLRKISDIATLNAHEWNKYKYFKVQTILLKFFTSTMQRQTAETVNKKAIQLLLKMRCIQRIQQQYIWKIIRFVSINLYAVLCFGKKIFSKNKLFHTSCCIVLPTKITGILFVWQKCVSSCDNLAFAKFRWERWIIRNQNHSQFIHCLLLFW